MKTGLSSSREPPEKLLLTFGLIVCRHLKARGCIVPLHVVEDDMDVYVVLSDL